MFRRFSKHIRGDNSSPVSPSIGRRTNSSPVSSSAKRINDCTCRRLFMKKTTKIGVSYIDFGERLKKRCKAPDAEHDCICNINNEKYLGCSSCLATEHKCICDNATTRQYCRMANHAHKCSCDGSDDRHCTFSTDRGCLAVKHNCLCHINKKCKVHPCICHDNPSNCQSKSYHKCICSDNPSNCRSNAYHHICICRKNVHSCKLCPSKIPDIVSMYIGATVHSKIRDHECICDKLPKLCRSGESHICSCHDDPSSCRMIPTLFRCSSHKCICTQKGAKSCRGAKDSPDHPCVCVSQGTINCKYISYRGDHECTCSISKINCLSKHHNTTVVTPDLSTRRDMLRIGGGNSIPSLTQVSGEFPDNTIPSFTTISGGFPHTLSSVKTDDFRDARDYDLRGRSSGTCFT